MNTEATMAKKRPKSEKPLPAGGQREEITAVRSTAAWKEWLAGFADAERTTPTSLIDKALADLAVKLGYKGPPKR